MIWPNARSRRSLWRFAPIRAGVVVWLAAFAMALPLSRAEATPPNIVVVLADDLGYGDIGCYGNQVIQTPHLDRFAAESLRLTDCYAAAANCSPARCGLMTGRTPYRVGIHNWIPMFSPMHVRESEITIATLLRAAGYATCHVGKWHLNGRFNLSGQPQPSDHGFEHWFSTQNNALPTHHNPDNFVRNGKEVGTLEGYSAEIVAGEAIDWLTRRRDRDKPFFLFVCFHEPHEPIDTDPKFMKLYDDGGDPSRARHHGNVTQMDHAFGRLVKTLEELDVRKETLMLFTSDNGPAITGRHPHGSSGPLRDKKGAVYEGGIRVPGLIHWPGRTKPGSTSDQPVSGVDLLPTLCEVAGIEIPADRKLDGTSWLPMLAGQPISRKTPLYWQFNYAHSKPKVVLRSGDWKLLAQLTGPELRPTADITAEANTVLRSSELHAFELYNVRSDIGETRNLAEAEPERTRELAAQLRRIHREVCAESPVWPVWTSPRYEAGRIRAFYESQQRNTP